MTYNQLKAHIEVMDAEQLQQDVTFFDGRGEFTPVGSIQFADPEFNDVLDPNHPYLQRL